ncbi:glycosyltransferase family 4 protein [Salinarimonas sp.]|uniref:glycosyltransferase family 4 protein n=1 Tax=Salinarimonas sp. TaxID=2766526 RepID=UPI0032D97323
MDDSNGRRFKKVLLAATEDWFILSHFRPLISALRPLCSELVVVTRCAGREGEIRALGARVVHLPFRRKSLNAAEQGLAALRLARVLEAERPDVVHLVALNPIVIGAAAIRLFHVPAVVAHVTGLGYLGTARNLAIRAARRISFSLVDRMLNERVSWVLAENASDLIDLRAFGVAVGEHATVLGGAGVDPNMYTAAPHPQNDVPVAASVSRLIHSKGLDVLVSARDLLVARGIPLRVRVFGRHDPDNPETIAPDQLQKWLARGAIEGGYETRDVPSVWRDADIAVLPARTREGMPRSMLEAAACGRPLIVTDVPGLRDFVRDEQEGIVVPPNDPVALADALERLSTAPELRVRMGEAARARILSHFTEAHVIESIERVYMEMAARLRAEERRR